MKRYVLWGLALVAIIVAVYLIAGTHQGNPETATAVRSKLPPTLANDQPNDGVNKPGRMLGEQYEKSTDLYALTLELRALSEAGDGNASRTIARAYQECWTYAGDPLGFKEDMKLRSQLRPDLSQSIEAVTRKIEERCRGFIGTRISPDDINQILEKAASQGDLASEVQLFGAALAKNDSALDVESQKELAERVLRSSDADAYAAMAEVMGPLASGRLEALAPLPAGTVSAEAAWQIAACRLGRDCSAGSSTVAQMCIGGGVNCSLRSLEQFYLQEMLPPADQIKLRQQVNVLLQGKEKT